METLILSTNDSSAGRLKDSKAADGFIALCQRLVEGPLPSETEQAAFFGAVQPQHEPKDDIDHWQSWIGFAERRRLGAVRPALVEKCHEYNRIEIWTDPDPNSYLILFQLLEALKLHREILDRLSLAFPARRVGELSHMQFKKARPQSQPLTQGQLNLASRAWYAHRSNTPEAWFTLLHEDLAEMPGLRSLILSILAELPAATNGLSASEAQLLGLIRSNSANHDSVIGGYLQQRPWPTLGYWQAGQRVVSLSRCNPPVILGVDEDSFSLDLHDDEARFAAYRARKWSLSALGRRTLEGQDDLAEFVSIDRWVGNTHLMPDRLWRWDAASEALVEPR